MSEEILINVTPRETRVAVVESGMLQEVHIERPERRHYLGNVYVGTVSRVLPGMQAAFVDIGLERAAFLHANDINVLADETGEEQDTPPISDMLRAGQRVVVQVIKDPLGTKGARLTTQISLPSRYLVLLPNNDMLGVSTRIEDEEERERLKDLVRSSQPDGDQCGYIVRTNAEGVDAQDLGRDMDYLHRLWRVVSQRASERDKVKEIYEDLALPLRAVRDLLHSGVEKIRIDSHEWYQRTEEFVAKFIPQAADTLELYTGERPIFDLYGVEDEIQRALKRHVPLKSGGHLVIDQTEAMTTIDVNTGAYVGHRNLEETIYKTNLEAAQAIARQLRLRNLGGIIILDFIDMTDEEHRRQLLRTLAKNLERDHARTKMSDISSLGLIEMTRKRTTESLEHILCEPCANCNGRGAIKTADTVCFEIFREILRSVRQFDADRLMVLASPLVVQKILDEQSSAVAELEEFIGKNIHFKSEDQYLQEQYDVVLL
ncbi:MAG: ribonuclease G [Lysobacteraceae bacterium]|nr:MAG: ribonuclease G [Xanthomonadaceae bacterium]